MVSSRLAPLTCPVWERRTGTTEYDETQPTATPTIRTTNFDILIAKITQSVVDERWRGAASFASTWWGSPPSTIGLLEENWQLQSEVHALRRSLADIQSRLSQLEATAPSVKLVVLREVSREQAKNEIRQLFRSAETLDYEEIVEKLQIDLELVVDICDELMEAGEIGPDAGIHTSG